MHSAPGWVDIYKRNLLAYSEFPRVELNSLASCAYPIAIGIQQIETPGRFPFQISFSILSAARLTSRKIRPSLALGLAIIVTTASGPAWAIST